MQQAIENISDIKIGFPGQAEVQGNIPFLQLRQFNDDGMLLTNDADYIKLTEKIGPHVLQNGDVLFVGKGHRLFAWCYIDKNIPTVASSSFFVIRPNTKKIHPEYLAAILNAPQTKTALMQLGGGTNIFSIRKSELAAFQIPVLPMDQQIRVASLASFHQKEIQLAKELISQKQSLYSAIISKLIK
ncbi:restriction endonuclease subunit S [Ferruginibacter paludis]|uniref:restriction endonuclease subunit S n=1 Tax=Ferruginibacter paludis TaxID=1310417 RepID=UPI0025B28D57|nr:restriction endonuclease subunit S [Ferruginibacter paludis]MDN3657826.1 restriction endonuclease subunit S [Ferruginibacter paludis]